MNWLNHGLIGGGLLAIHMVYMIALINKIKLFASNLLQMTTQTTRGN